MKYQCEVIKDLLTLYVDDLSSKESKKIIEEHLEICDSCKQYYSAMKSSDKIITGDTNNEILADSLKKIKNQIKAKHMLAVTGTLIIVFAFLFVSAVAIIGLQHMDYIIPYSENITLTQETPEEWQEWYTDRDNQLIICAKGKQIVGMISEVVEIEVEKDKTEKVLFFNVTTTPWHDIITKDNDISYQFLSNIEVDKVYYYPGYMMDVEMIADGELPAIIETSTLLWENN